MQKIKLEPKIPTFEIITFGMDSNQIQKWLET
jgi:hypothetical protein